MSSEPPKQKCKGTRKDGKPCTSPVVLSNGYCRVHRDQVPKGAAVDHPSAVEDQGPETATQERPSTIHRRNVTRRKLLQADGLKKIAKGLFWWAVGSAAWDETKKRADRYDEPVKEFSGDFVNMVDDLVDDLKKLAAPHRAPIPSSEPQPLRKVHPQEPEMILVPAGKFLMGSDPGRDKDAYGDEQPQHSLHLPDYYLAKTPATNSQYLAFVQATGHQAPRHWEDGRLPSGKQEHPVVHVSWHDAVAYCRWLAEATGRPYRLPSEAEWEKGARGTDGRIYPWGNQWDASRCNSWEGGPRDTTPVGKYPRGASPYGVLDMAGNVWEWTGSLWGLWGKDLFQAESKYPYDPADGRENLKAGDDVYRVLRGGAFGFYQYLVRCASRSRDFPNCGDVDIGFRVVVSLISRAPVL